MKVIIGIILIFITTLPIFALARIAGLADKRLEEIQTQAVKKEAGDLNGN